MELGVSVVILRNPIHRIISAFYFQGHSPNWDRFGVRDEFVEGPESWPRINGTRAPPSRSASTSNSEYQNIASRALAHDLSRTAPDGRRRAARARALPLSKFGSRSWRRSTRRLHGGGRVRGRDHVVRDAPRAKRGGRAQQRADRDEAHVEDAVHDKVFGVGAKTHQVLAKDGGVTQLISEATPSISSCTSTPSAPFATGPEFQRRRCGSRDDGERPEIRSRRRALRWAASRRAHRRRVAIGAGASRDGRAPPARHRGDLVPHERAHVYGRLSRSSASKSPEAPLALTPPLPEPAPAPLPAATAPRSSRASRKLATDWSSSRWSSNTAATSPSTWRSPSATACRTAFAVARSVQCSCSFATTQTSPANCASSSRRARAESQALTRARSASVAARARVAAARTPSVAVRRAQPRGELLALGDLPLEQLGARRERVARLVKVRAADEPAFGAARSVTTRSLEWRSASVKPAPWRLHRHGRQRTSSFVRPHSVRIRARRARRSCVRSCGGRGGEAEGACESLPAARGAAARGRAARACSAQCSSSRRSSPAASTSCWRSARSSCASASASSSGSEAPRATAPSAARR